MSGKWFHATTIPPEGARVSLDLEETRHATRWRQFEAGAEVSLRVETAAALAVLGLPG